MATRKLAVFIAVSSIMGSGCSLTATRPIQEMSNAEAALKAAKDLNADSLIPEVYRAASENYFKAKREYRLKNFENALKFSLKATRLAEQAEFEAYRMGGATPEAATHLVSPEGSSADADATLRETAAPPPSEEKSLHHSKKEPTLPPETQPPIEYKPPEPESDKKTEDRKNSEDKKSEDKKPNGPSGPQGPSSNYNTYTPPGTVPPGTTFNDRVVPTAGAVPGITGNVPANAPTSKDAPTDLWQREKYDRLQINRNQYPLSPSGPELDSMGQSGIPELGRKSDGTLNTIENVDEKKPIDQSLDQAVPKPFLRIEEPIPAPTVAPAKPRK